MTPQNGSVDMNNWIRHFKATTLCSHKSWNEVEDDSTGMCCAGTDRINGLTFHPYNPVGVSDTSRDT